MKIITCTPVRRCAPWFSRLSTPLKTLLPVLLVMLLSACDSSDTSVGTPKSTPQNLIANPGTRVIELAWSGVSGASAYSVYWSNQAEVNPEQGTLISTPEPYLEHRGLANGVNYYYVVTAHTGRGESRASEVVSATPLAAVPAKPSVVNIAGGDERITLDWASIAGASHYTLYWNTEGNVSRNDNRIDQVVSPFVHSELTNNQSYSYILVAENAVGSGSASTELSATPQRPAPSAPLFTDITPGSAQATLAWRNISNASGYTLYWNTTGEVGVDDTAITQVTSPYTVTGLAEGTTYYYRLQAHNSGGDSPLSNLAQVSLPSDVAITRPPVNVLPAQPANVTVSLGNSQLTLTWDVVEGALGYSLYWSNEGSSGDIVPGAAGVQAIAIGQAIATARVSYTHIGLNNGSNYRYRVSAFNQDGESELSAEVSGAPEVITPGVPAGLRAIAGDQTLGIRWNGVQGASTYSLYLTDAQGAPQAIPNVSSPYTLSDLTNGSAYQIQVRAVSGSTESPLSEAISATPHEPVPNAPLNPSAQPGNGQVTLQWDSAAPQDLNDAEQAISGYQVYYHRRAGVSPSNGTLLNGPDSGLTPSRGDNGRWQLTHGGLQNRQRYYYRITAVNAGGEGRASAEVWGRPQISIPGAPSQVWAEAGDNQVVIHFEGINSTVVPTYNLYWRQDLGNGQGSDGQRSDTQVISNIQPDYVFNNGPNTNGNTYTFQVSAFNSSGESVLSPEVSASPQVAPPQVAPQTVLAAPQPNEVSLSWSPVSDATGYAIYWSTEPNINSSTSTKISLDGAAQTRYQHTALDNGQPYYYQISAVNPGGESGLSAPIAAEPQVPPPAIPKSFNATPEDNQVVLGWRDVDGATSYRIYWHSNPEAPLEQWTTRNGVQAGDVISGLTNGQPYYFRLSALNPGGESIPSTVVVTAPLPPPPAIPTGFAVAAGNAQTSLHWHTQPQVSYALYWSTDPNVAPIDSNNQLSGATIRPTYLHQQLVNGTTYYYQLSARNIGGESAPSAIVSVTPQVPASGAPQALSAQSGDQQITLQWLAPSENTQTRYTLYWSTTPNQGINGTAIASVSAPYVHRGVTNGQTYYYVITATNDSGFESVPSAPAMAQAIGQVPATPTGLWLSAGDTQNTLHWRAVANAERYQVEWSTQADLRNSTTETVDAPNTQYQHTDLAADQGYYYRLSASNPQGSSAPSAILRTTPGTISNNQPPQIQQGALQTVTLDEDSSPIAFSLNLDASDNDGDSLSWILASPASNGNADVIGAGNRASVIYNPDSDYHGNDGFQIQVSDGQGGIASIQIDVIITSQNDAPRFNVDITNPNSNNSDFIEGLAITASDVDGDSLIYSAVNLPPGLSINPGTGTISGTIDALASLNSPYASVITVSDQTGTNNATASYAMQWSVMARNADPATSTASITPSQTEIVAGTEVIITVVARDASGNSLSTGGDNPSLQVSGANAIASLALQDNNNGTYTGRYTTTRTGQDDYVITLGATPIGGGPYGRSIIAAGADINTSGFNIPAGPYPAGQVVTIDVQINDANSNPSSGTVSIDVSGSNPQTLVGLPQEGRGSYRAQYTPTIAGSDSYRISVNDVALAGQVPPVTRSINAAAADATTSTVTVPAGPYTAGAAVDINADIKDSYNNPTSATVAIVIRGANAQSLSPESLGNGRYNAQYTPALVGTDTLAITIDGTAASGSPYTRVINASSADASQSVASIPAGPYTAGQPVTLQVAVSDRSGNPASGFVTIVITGNNAQVLNAVDQGDSVYLIQYTPSIVGTDTLLANVDGNAIGSAVSRSVNAGSASVANSRINLSDEPLSAGETVTIQALVNDASNNPTTGTVTIAVSGANAQALTVSNPTLGTYSANYTATTAGTDSYTVTINASAVTPAPTRTITAGAADINTSSFSIPAGPHTANNAVSIDVLIRDANNNPGNGTVTIDISGSNPQTITGIAQATLGSYTASYTPTVSGSDSYTVNVNNVALAGQVPPSSRTINAGSANASNSLATIPAGPYTAGNSITLQAQINDANNNATTGVVAFVITGSNPQSLTGLTQGNGLYTVQYTPTIAGNDGITASIDGNALPGGSVTRTINAASAVAANSTVVITPAIDPISANTAVNFTLTTNDANNNLVSGAGNVAAVSINGGEPIALNDQGNGSHIGGYTATQAGTDTYVFTLRTSAVPAATIIPGSYSKTINNLAPESVIAPINPPANLSAGDAISLNGSGSSDPDGHTPLSYAWSISNGNINLSSTAAQPTVDLPEGGVYTITLVVTDSLGLADASPATASVTVNSPPTAIIASPAADTTINLNASVDFQGSGNDDQDAATALSYQWDFGAASGITPRTSTQQNPGLKTFANSGSFSVSLTVTDSKGKISAAVNRVISVNANQAPNGTITSTNPTGLNIGDSITLTASGADPDNHTPLTYDWVLVNGATTLTASGANTGAITLPVAGAYTITLTVKDNLGLADPTPATTTVNVNTPPTAVMVSPATNSSISLGGTVDFQGQGSDAEDAPASLSYQWDYGAASGITPSTSTLQNPGTQLFNNSGSFPVSLTVTDTNGAVSSTVSRTITVAANQAPNGTITSAIPTGLNIGDSITLTASGADPDNHTPLTYDWVLVNGETTLTASGANTGAITLPVAGAYAITLTVKDNLGLADSTPATASVTVNTPPPATFFVSTSSGIGGRMSPFNATVDQGKTASFTASPTGGYKIASVTGCGGTLVGDTYTTGVITEDCTVTASFSIIGNTWKPAGIPANNYEQHTSTLLPNGNVLVTAGYESAIAELYDPVKNSWSAAAKFPVPRTEHTATLLPNGKVLVVGGFNLSVTYASAELYDPITNRWSPAGNLATGRYYHTATLLPNGKVLVVGGANRTNGVITILGSAELYDPDTNTWSDAPRLPAARQHHSASLLPDGRLMITGGLLSGGARLATTEVFDPVNNTWTSAARMTIARYQHTSTILPNGSVMVSGGFDVSGVTDSVEVYDAVQNFWSTAPNLPTARRLHTATAMGNGKILILGGLDVNGGYLASAELFDPATNRWVSATKPATSRAFQTTTVLGNGNVLVVGGYSDIGKQANPQAELYTPLMTTPYAWRNAANPARRFNHTGTLLRNGNVLIAAGFISGAQLDTSELYDYVKDGWAAAGNLTTKRREHTANLLASGKVLAVGGFGDNGILNSAEVYDPVSNSWSSGGRLTDARFRHSSDLLPNGKVLVAGGGLSGNYLATTELYDPVTNLWSAGINLITGRSNHASILLPNGKLLITGGNSAVGVLNSVEIYDPVTNKLSAAANMINSRTTHKMLKLPNGKIVVVGGYNFGGVSDAEIYDYTTNTWTAAAALPTRNNYSFTLLHNGTPVLLGTSAGDRDARLYFADTDSWGVGGRQTVHHDRHSATLLPNGELIVVGDHSISLPEYSNAELYGSFAVGD